MLIPCNECRAKMSETAASCPTCGAPNARAVKRSKDRSQGLGCLLILLAIPASLFLTPLGGIIVGAIGLVVMVLNTRLR